jgi:hypothetical protein
MTNLNIIQIKKKKQNLDNLKEVLLNIFIQNMIGYVAIVW